MWTCRVSPWAPPGAAVTPVPLVRPGSWVRRRARLPAGLGAEGVGLWEAWLNPEKGQPALPLQMLPSFSNQGVRT